MASGSLEELTASFSKKDGVVLKLRRRARTSPSSLRKLAGRR